MKKVGFVFSPYLPSVTRHPYLSIYLLSSILEREGYECEKFDLNLELNKLVYKENIYKSLCEEADHLEIDKQELKVLKKANEFREKMPNIAFIPDWIWSQTNAIVARYISKVPQTLPDLFSNGIEWHPEVNKVLDTIAKRFAESDLDVIAFSVAFGEQLPYTLELIDRIKKLNPEKPIIMGGAQISLLDASQIKLIQENSAVDLIFQGYAEEKIVNLIEKLSVCREKPLAISGNALTRESLKQLPFVNFDYDDRYNGNHMYPILVTKGCYWGKCKFCDYVLMGDLGGERYIGRPVEDAFEEMKAIRKKDPRADFILISDAVPPQWYKKLAIMANAENFKLNTYSYMINNKALNEEFFAELSKAHVKSFVFGTESTSDRVLNLMAKQANRDIIIDNFKLARKYGIKIKVNLIPNYPTTTYREAMDAFKVIKEYKDIIMRIAVFKFYLSANTSMFENPSEFGLEIDDAPYLKSEHNGFHTVSYSNQEGMSPEEEKKVFVMFQMLMKEIERIHSKDRVSQRIENEELEFVSFRTSFELLKENGKEYLFDPTTQVKVPYEGTLKDKISSIYGPDLVPLYTSVKEFLDKNQEDKDALNYLLEKNLLTA